MDQTRKVGVITIVVSLVLAATAVAFSTNPCHAEVPLTSVLLNCIRIEDLPDFGEYTSVMKPYVLTKYLLLACAVLAAIGYLWLKGVLPVPGVGQAQSAGKESGTRPHDINP